MIDPFADDSWDELTRELGVEKSPPHREPEPPLAEEIAEHPDFEDDSQGDDGEFDGDLGDETEGEGEGDAPDGTEPAAGDEQPGSGRKRRRRRRRRKKGPGIEGEATEGETEEVREPAPPVAPRQERAPVPARAARVEPEFAEPEYDMGSDDEEPAGLPLAAEEDTAGEVLRELIANWNVPSWDSIITGLNRPER